ncbi:hypothetical protein LOZ61_006432 [Ophidiomyces ophidiicola]|uniref:uncharacterized protein n=1 Tax=Ophidiomyces ophidiicola TaxID=1387563 RepID=UPI0020C23026|nr:uncharacterized protein LOZ57_001057 [Ophidiomyces ophidiicola]KAI1906874.1 hypothetical protein LOZ61_006432 [Ophidiomyces ophidiicola]KAI1922297.1 hypothetical protein LOZ60_005781 [Ophidiomyces ophidiicola]KAI1951389.1 hypothetical protein LOZ59_005645 [Ophidiomyces ophidiicola]KAI1952973.1 hypothetical protein LOZ57_001057 [Ophidiomyces ophidiicola]KAI2006236.1 hypothetical protein LOZ49_005091 [Ophidiomyces ophidiicola]
MIQLDGSTLEGGGQLVRNAIALSALTSQPVRVTKIRGRRQGARGLRPSHAAAIQCLLDICGGSALGATVGSSEITFYPRGQNEGTQTDASVADDDSTDNITALLESMKLEPVTGVPPIKSEYNIRLTTPGSAFLIFQALYPYILYAGACAAARTAEKGESPPEFPIKLKMTGGTNVSFSPSYDYVSQVLIPNFARLGLPQLKVTLKRRGWTGGRTNLGAVVFLIHPLEIQKVDALPPLPNRQPACCPKLSTPCFPRINLDMMERGTITHIDITVLAPDVGFDEVGSGSGSIRRKGPKSGGKLGKGRESDWERKGLEGSDAAADDSDLIEEQDLGGRSAPHSIREFVENRTFEAVFSGLNCQIGSTQGLQPPTIRLYHSEPTRHYSHIYILLVAHTSTGFRLGRDALFGSEGAQRSSGRSHQGAKDGKSRGKTKSKPSSGIRFIVEDMVAQCVSDLMDELIGSDPSDSKGPLGGGKSRRVLDMFMRDQVVIFQALGSLGVAGEGEPAGVDQGGERDQKSLHTQTAMWVCRQMLGAES